VLTLNPHGDNSDERKIDFISGNKRRSSGNQPGTLQMLPENIKRRLN
jgi:hypothetical protein